MYDGIARIAIDFYFTLKLIFLRENVEYIIMYYHVQYVLNLSGYKS